MKLYLIRHGETVDNVAQIYAGVRDSALTSHGSLQAERLGNYLAEIDGNIAEVYSSDLQRAKKTAEAIRNAQLRSVTMDTCEKFPEVTQLRLLREQDFGYYEGKHFYTRPRDMNKTGKDSHRTQYIDEPGFKDVESKESMTTRMDSFLDEYLIPRLHGSTANKPNIAIVSHGIILSVLWRCLLKRFPAQSVALAPGLTIRGTGETTPLQYLGGWSNTGYLELVLYQEVTCQTPTSEPGSAPASAAVSFDRTEDPANITAKPKSFAISGWRMFIRTVNGKNHLRGLKRTGGGVGSSKHDEGQRKIESFFKKQKIG